MAFTEDFDPYFADFGVDATLQAVAKSVILDTSSADEFGVVTQTPSAVLAASEASGAAAGQTLVANGVTYTVRAVIAEPPDGALVRLELARV